MQENPARDPGESRGRAKAVGTTLGDVAVLPSDEGVGGVAPGLRLFTAGVAAEVLGVLHLGEDVERRPIVRVRMLAVPSLARQPFFGHAHIALVETTATLHTRTCNGQRGHVTTCSMTMLTRRKVT